MKPFLLIITLMLNLNLFGKFNFKIKDFKLKKQTVTANPNTEDSLTYTIKSYETVVKINNNETSISFDPDELEISLVSICKFISKQVNWISKNENAIKNQIVNDLLELAEDWLPEGKDTITKEEFLNQISITDITFLDNESCTIYYCAGEIFGGHGINIELNSNKELEKAVME